MHRLAFIFFTIFISFSLSGCFSWFDFSKEQKQQTIIEDAPAWVQNPAVEGFVTQLGVSKNIKVKNYSFYREIAILNGTQNLSRKLYIKTFNILNRYWQENSDEKLFEKDIKEVAKQIALKSVKKVKIINSFKSKNNSLFIHLVVDSNEVVENIQAEAKNIFKVNKLFIDYFSIKESKIKIKKELEN